MLARVPEKTKGREKMTKTAKAERRQHPRIIHKLPLKVVANGYDFATSTHDLSCVGAYCRIDKYVPPFTKVMVRLSLPITSNNTAKDHRVECKGVIVRTEDENDGGFNVAIFFNNITEPQKKIISQYVNQFLS